MKTAHSWLANITCWYFPWSQVTRYLRQYLCKIWGQHSGAAETSGLLGCDTASGGWVAPHTFKDHSAFIFRVKESKKSHYLTSEMKTTSRISHSTYGATSEKTWMFGYGCVWNATSNHCNGSGNYKISYLKNCRGIRMDLKENGMWKFKTDLNAKG